VRTLALALLLASAAPAAAQCPRSTPIEGATVHHCMMDGLEWVQARVDLGGLQIGLRVSTPTERQQTAADWAGATGARLAVQAGPYRFPEYQPTGLTVGNGVHWRDSADDGEHAVLWFDNRGVGAVVPADQVIPGYDATLMHNVISGAPLLLDGEPVTRCTGVSCTARPATAVGLSADGQLLIIVVVRGWSADVPGVDDAGLAELMIAAGADDAIRTGEGATSVFFTAGTEGPFLVGSSDGAERAGAAWLGVVDSTVEPVEIRGVVEETDTEARLTEATVWMVGLDGTEVARGFTEPTEARFTYTVAPREYFVFATLPGFRDGCVYCRGQDVAVDAMGIRHNWCSLFMVRGEGPVDCRAPPRTLDVGPFPLASRDAGGLPDAGPRADGGSGGGGGCAVAGRAPDRSFLALLAVLAILVLRRK
jgi:hypothetical protein